MASLKNSLLTTQQDFFHRKSRSNPSIKKLFSLYNKPPKKDSQILPTISNSTKTNTLADSEKILTYRKNLKSDKRNLINCKISHAKSHDYDLGIIKSKVINERSMSPTLNNQLSPSLNRVSKRKLSLHFNRTFFNEQKSKKCLDEVEDDNQHQSIYNSSYLMPSARNCTTSVLGFVSMEKWFPCNNNNNSKTFLEKIMEQKHSYLAENKFLKSYRIIHDDKIDVLNNINKVFYNDLNSKDTFRDTNQIKQLEEILHDNESKQILKLNIPIVE